MKNLSTIVNSLFFGSCFITLWYGKVTNDSSQIQFLEPDILMIFGLLFFSIAGYLIYLEYNKNNSSNNTNDVEEV